MADHPYRAAFLAVLRHGGAAGVGRGLMFLQSLHEPSTRRWPTGAFGIDQPLGGR
jgi:hypothetical protein